MSFSGLFAIGVSGVSAFTSSLESVSHNIANSQTVGFKRARTDFSDLVTIDAPEAGGRIGAGVAAAPRQLLAEQGALARTGNPTDIAISGDGFFVVGEGADATTRLFTRAGDFSPNEAGALVNGAGHFLLSAPQGQAGALAALQPVNLFAGRNDFLSARIDETGDVYSAFANGEEVRVARLPLALFTNPQGLTEARGSAFEATSASGPARLASAGQGRAGSIESGAVETSTVDIGREFATLIETQRAYATNARVISLADEMWRALVETAA
ncbi:MAG: flagellar hook-basal body protein [Amphiplicatus sp.]